MSRAVCTHGQFFLRGLFRAGSVAELQQGHWCAAVHVGIPTVHGKSVPEIP